MDRRSSLVVAVAGVVAITGWGLLLPQSGEPVRLARADEPNAKAAPKKVAMKAFMRKKLEHSQNIMEGLTSEDFDVLEKGARQLKTTSAAAEFMVYNDPLYAQFAGEFGRTVEKLEKAAKEKRLDGATLAFVDMTMSCVECHKYVRNVLVAAR